MALDRNDSRDMSRDTDSNGPGVGPGGLGTGPGSPNSEGGSRSVSGSGSATGGVTGSATGSTSGSRSSGSGSQRDSTGDRDRQGPGNVGGSSRSSGSGSLGAGARASGSGSLGDISRAQAEASARAGLAGAARGTLGMANNSMRSYDRPSGLSEGYEDSVSKYNRERTAQRARAAADRMGMAPSFGASIAGQPMGLPQTFDDKPAQVRGFAPPEVVAFGSNDFGQPEIAVRSLEEAVANARKLGRTPVAVMPNPNNPKTQAVARAMEAAARRLGIETYTPQAWAGDGIHPAQSEYDALGKRFDGAVVRGDSFAEGITAAQNNKHHASFARRSASSADVMDAASQIDSRGLASVDSSLTSPRTIEDAAAQARANLLSTLKSAEATKNANPYESLVGSRTVPGLTGMTIGQVMNYQRALKGDTAIGAYQIVKNTMPEAMRLAGLTQDDLYNEQNQDKMALALASARMEQSRRRDGSINPNDLAHALASEWAGIATPKSGKSVYAGVNKNKASVPASRTVAIARDLLATDALGRSTTVKGTTAPTSFADKYLTSGVKPNATDFRQSAETAYFGMQPTDAWDTFAELQPGLETAPQVATGPKKGVTPDVPATPASTTKGDPIFGGETLPGDFPDRPRSLGKQVAATGIDIGIGMAPVVGIPASIINAGLVLTGNRTIGTRVVDLLGEGGDGVFTGYSGEPGSRTEKKPTGKPRKTDTTIASVEPETSFEDKYLAFNDPVKRPTPDQKWGSGATYSL